MTSSFTIADLSPWIEVRYDAASGPGGQHVNKVATRATLLFDFTACDRLSPVQRERIRQRYATRLARDGRLRVVAQRHRSQAGNRAAAEARLLELLAVALHVPKTRRPTRPTAGARGRRLAEKRRRSETKSRRQSRPTRDE